MPSGGIADRTVGLVGGPGQRGSDQDRIDELSGAAGQLLGCASDQLGEDHARVATGAEQRRAGDRGDDLVATDLVDRVAFGGVGEPVELLQDRAQREHHVVARVAIGDREDVEVVDLLAARLERRQPRLDDGPKPNDARIGHAVPAARSARCDHISWL